MTRLPNQIQLNARRVRMLGVFFSTNSGKLCGCHPPQTIRHGDPNASYSNWICNKIVIFHITGFTNSLRIPRFVGPKRIGIAILCILMNLGNSAHAVEAALMAEILPPCGRQPLGLIRVLRGDTLSGLSRRMKKPSAISYGVWENLIYESNQNSFIESNRDLIREGANILFPCFESIPYSEDQPNSTSQSTVADIANSVRKSEADIMQIRKLVEVQAEKIEQLVESQKTPRTEARLADSFYIFTSGLSGLTLLSIIILGLYMYRRSASLSVPTSQALSLLEHIRQFLPKLETTMERANIHIQQHIPNNKSGEGSLDKSKLWDYLKRLIQVDIAIDDFMRDDGAESEALKVIKMLSEDALESCGVETFAPEIGEDYRRAESVADYPKTKKTDNPKDKFKIVEILEKGYRISTPEGYDVIHPARVRIFTTDQEA